MLYSISIFSFFVNLFSLYMIFTTDNVAFNSRILIRCSNFISTINQKKDAAYTSIEPKYLQTPLSKASSYLTV
jgi:hypothetical protein